MNGLKFLFSDCHEWLRVPLVDYWRCGIHDQVSNYSYADAQHVYLKSDVDAWLYLDLIGHVDASALPFEQLRGSRPGDISRDIVRFDQYRPGELSRVGKEGTR